MSVKYTLVDDNFNQTDGLSYIEARESVAYLAPGESVTICRDPEPEPTKEFHAYYMGHAKHGYPSAMTQHKTIQAVDFQAAAVRAFSGSQHSTGARWLITGEGSDVLDMTSQQARIFEAVECDRFDDYDLHVDLGSSTWVHSAYRHGYYTIHQVKA